MTTSASSYPTLPQYIPTVTLAQSLRRLQRKALSARGATARTVEALLAGIEKELERRAAAALASVR